MKTHQIPQSAFAMTTLREIAQFTDYSLLESLNCDPDATTDGADHSPRQVCSGHFVPVTPAPIENPEYIAHSHTLFRELGFADSMALSDDFMRLFSGDLSSVPAPMRQLGWACGYALSIYGTEYTRQCPFQTGNGYGDGRAISVLEAVLQGQRWEMQLKGGGRTPYCRGADGRAVLRSSVREFLAQEHMHALGVPTSRSLSLYVSKTETATRPWYSEGARSSDPDRLVSEPVAITTRVAPSFIRVGQIELFARRARNGDHPQAMKELELIVTHLMDREYAGDIDPQQALGDKVVLLADAFSHRLASLVANWIRVGYCQGNFNSDNCAAGGFTLDYGPFGFCDVFNPYFQPWTGGGRHFSFLNQPAAAERNFTSFCSALRPLLADRPDQLAQLEEIQLGFADLMQKEMESMWAAKLGLAEFDPELFSELISLMMKTPVDYTLFFRELSAIPDTVEALKNSFYSGLSLSGEAAPAAGEITSRWAEWLEKWRSAIGLDQSGEAAPDQSRLREQVARSMKQVNPKTIWREWLVVPAYQQAAAGNYDLIRELQDIMTRPYEEQTSETAEKFYQLKPLALFDVGGVSHYSCSS
ncbi:MAG: protein adenylyltransferase SelO family protein [Natronospirillum sp.]|uniref:protein adenylyltransferase SelO n=1 Tax=Natronospirillum sp. TaxID=2812955 RepID=UPI0025DCB252|nr:protein adenylyltransferase SelO family protein [Natronospirillum sp.]MCH8551907.1 protein adenylyltransferase SelO family protein [Natronospirillum sp.]